ncbi:MAG: hypothetical protein KC419_21980 [Anaerolineales bacterium]|nr:hypothetical protein [Anaerolineales bacterium]
MKRILLLSIAVLLLVGCGADLSSQDGLSNAAKLGWDEGVAAIMLDLKGFYENPATQVWTDMRPLADTNVALVTYRVEMEEDALKLGGDGPYYLYGGGLLQIKGDDVVFTDIDQFSAEGEAQFRAYQASSSGEAAIVDWLGEPRNLAGFGAFGTKGFIPADAIKPGDGNASGEIIMASVATAGNGTETAVLTTNENITELADFTCFGRMIPNSNQASLSYTAKTTDDRILVGAGIGLLHNMPAAKADTTFECTMDGKGGVAYRAAVDHVEGAEIVGLVVEGLKVRTANGQTTSIDKATVYGFNIGMPPGGDAAWGTVLTDFNIGMPPN